MTSTEFNVGLGTTVRNSSKVLKPPGGGSSDIFGTSGHTAEPQRKARSHLTSSIFGGEETQTPARKAGNDSFYNLFGGEPQCQSRPGTAARNNLRSNIVLDDASLEVKKSLFLEKSENGETEVVNGCGANGVDVEETVHSNGVEEEEVTPAATNGEKAEPVVNGSSSAPVAAPTAPSAAPVAPAPAPVAPTAAPAKQRVPPGGFSSGLW